MNANLSPAPLQGANTENTENFLENAVFFVPSIPKKKRTIEGTEVVQRARRIFQKTLCALCLLCVLRGHFLTTEEFTVVHIEVFDIRRRLCAKKENDRSTRRIQKIFRALLRTLDQVYAVKTKGKDFIMP